MRKTLAAAALGAALITAAGPAGALPAANPSGTGLPGQSCQDIVAAGGSLPSTQSGLSPGSPFNEPSGSNLGGTGGQNYNQTSQYDVACFQVSS